MNTPTCNEDIAALVREDGPPAIAQGAGTKAPLCHVAGETRLINLSGIAGIIDYDPSEYVFTARAGSTLKEINTALRKNGQYLPFDPPLVEAGGTLGGTVAAGLSGPGRIRYGGLRDFIIGAKFVNGEGKILKGGGKVVKNAAGFDFPKFLAGSLGRLAIFLEISFKVFPEPEGRLTMRFNSKSLIEGLGKLLQASLSSWEPEALELEADGQFFLRLAGDRSALRPRAERILGELGGGVILDEEAASIYWRNLANFSWSHEHSTFAKVPISPQLVPRLDAALTPLLVERRYGLAGNVAWLAWSESQVLAEVDAALRELGLPGLVLRGDATGPFLGHRRNFAIHDQIKHAFDPEGRFPSFS